MRRKIHESNTGGIVVAMCDDEIIGEVFEEGDLVLDVKEDFYDGHMGDRAFEIALSKASSINAIGEKSVAYLIEKSIITNEQQKKISGIPYTFIVLT